MSYELKHIWRQGIAEIWRKGLTGGAIKIIGVILMIFDHLHQMFYAHGTPDWFTWLGRPVLPIFLFMCAEGFHYTRSRREYLLRLFICFEFMNAANTALSSAMPNENVMLINNVFGTMLLTAVYLLFTDMLRDGVREKRAGKVAASVLLMLFPVVYTLALVLLMGALPRQMGIALIFIPNLLAVEGGPSAIVLGVLFYVFRDKRVMQMIILSALSALSFKTAAGAQWMMIFASIPLLLYNGKRGNGNKYFFYIFYPAHIYLFYIIASTVK
jgi:hypothetical protein